MKISLENNTCNLTVDLSGGAIIDFHLKDDAQINPLSFAFTKEQMPANNKNGAPYQGHFLCLGRWGLPSDGEIKNGLPNHGEAANILWKETAKTNTTLHMQTTAKLEGLHVERTIELDNNNAVFAVKETITNINVLGRLYNIVQHPTLAAPFLNTSTIINCNASIGFDQIQYREAEKNSFTFPHVRDDKGNTFNLKNSQVNYNAVFSFVINENDNIGWLTAYSPIHNLLFGYVWERSDYPWIHLWQHWNEDELIYRGIEFGTAGIHQPYKEILNTATQLFGEKTFAYIDAAESVSKKYFSFIYKTENDFAEMENITVNTDCIEIKTANKIIKLATSFNLKNELS
ncbi:MAG: hypothetical protein ABI405_10075 [Parafilimonas sp.]